jgi:hypothetical protein
MKIAQLFLPARLLHVGDFRMRLFAAARYGQPAPAAFRRAIFR